MLLALCRDPEDEVCSAGSVPTRQVNDHDPACLPGVGGAKACMSLTELAHFVQEHNVDLLHGASPDTEEGEG